MDRPSRLAGLTLVSKYYPIANYSYPRQDGTPTPHNSRRSSNADSNDRSFLGLEGSSSPPGLVEDRTDSEASGDDDYQYHAHAAELWDSFWQPKHDEKNNKSPQTHPKKQYPALIPWPQNQNVKKCPQEPSPQPSQAWPLPDGQPERQRKPTPTYSPFPKPAAALPPPRTCWRQPLTPQRSTRCENGFLAPPTQELPGLTAPRSSPTSPISPTMGPRPATSHGSRPASPMDRRSPSPNQIPPSSSIYSGASRSATHLPLSEQHRQQSKPKTLRAYKSIAQLSSSCPLPQYPQPHSVFEYDTDSDCDDGAAITGQSPTLSFFRFHKRNGSDNTTNANNSSNNARRRSAAKAAQQSSVDAATAAQQRRRRRKRASTAPLSQQKQDQPVNKQEAPSTPGPKPRRQSDVLSRMLGRRSR